MFDPIQVRIVCESCNDTGMVLGCACDCTFYPPTKYLSSGSLSEAIYRLGLARAKILTIQNTPAGLVDYKDLFVATREELSAFSDVIKLRNDENG